MAEATNSQDLDAASNDSRAADVEPPPADLVAGDEAAQAPGLPSQPPAIEEAASPPSPADESQTAENANFEAEAMSKSASASSHPSSLKDEDASAGPEGYGTRSRNKAATSRPNYADDNELDMEIEMAGLRQNGARSRSLSSDAPAIRQVSPENAHAVALLTSRDGLFGSNMARSVPSADGDASTPAADRHPEKKKRKYERDSRKSTPNLDFIPGTSTFSFHSAGDHGSSKKRKISEGVEKFSRRKQSSAAKQISRGACVYSFEKSSALLKNGRLKSDDGTVFSVDDHVYLICEPPGDPYYLCRIMEFRHAETEDKSSPVVSMLVNWFYRPKDIQRYSADPRYLYASMQSDESPITSLRGKCQIKHRSEVNDLEDFRKRRDAFWFNQLYDRYIHRPYDVVPAQQVINVPERVKKALDERWKFIVVEPARLKELTSAIKLCKRCSSYCAPHDSVECAVCRSTYHMTCVRPPLQKKPSRGFGWSCGPCSKAQERKLKEYHTAVIQSPDEGEYEEEERVDEEAEEDDGANATTAPSPAKTEDQDEDTHPATQAEIDHVKMWPWRYLGIHCRVEDVLQYDDRAIYPRASSRLGPRHQANVTMWHGRPVELVKPAEIKRKYVKGSNNKKDTKLSKETIAALEAEKTAKAKRPKWVQDQPPGYAARGEDYPDDDARNTARRLFVIPEDSEQAPSEVQIDDYMDKAKAISQALGENTPSTNFLDKSLLLFQNNKFQAGPALAQLKSCTQKHLGNPVFTKEELKKFEEGVAKHGSDLRSVKKMVKRPYGDIVRFYYNWKKTPRGQEIWGHFDGRRRAKRRAEASWTDIADDEDDSAFDNDKAATRKRGFQCKHCATTSSRQWRRAPSISPGATILADPKGSSKDKANQLVVALCMRCAILWRKYALKYEDPEEIAKSIAQSGGRAWKRKNDEEMLRELVAANEAAAVSTTSLAAAAAHSMGIPVTMTAQPEMAKKKGRENESTPGLSSNESQPKKKAVTQPPPRPPTPPIVPQQPKLRTLPCAVCSEATPLGDEHLTCRDCRLTVHRACYGVLDNAIANKWVCDMCLNDRNAAHSKADASQVYECILCPVKQREYELLDPLKATHKKKTEREKEKEKIEKDLATEFLQTYTREQHEKGRPSIPREAMKRTADNNWIHVVCAIWTPEIKFSNAHVLAKAEGMGGIISMPARVESFCKICHKVHGACVSCYFPGCPSKFHVGCAHKAGYKMGFDIHPVKGSRKDMINTVTIAHETGSMSAAIWCTDHASAVKSYVHDVWDKESGSNSLQLFAQIYKQADLTLTGTARKANLLNQSTKVITHCSQRQHAMTNGVAQKPRKDSNTAATAGDDTEDEDKTISEECVVASDNRHCVTCDNDVSPRWHQTSSYRRNTANGDFATMESNGLTAVPAPQGQDRHQDEISKTYLYWQCHKCFLRKDPVPALERPNDLGSAVPQYPYPASQAPRQDIYPSMYPWPSHSHPSYSPRDLTGQEHRPMPPTAPVSDQWTSVFENTSICLHRGDTVYTLKGRDFGNLDADQTKIYHQFIQRVQYALGFDWNRHIIRSERNYELNSPNAFMKALIDLVMAGSREVHWHVVDKVVVYPHSRVNSLGTPGPHSPATYEHTIPLRSPASIDTMAPRQYSYPSPTPPTAYIAGQPYQHHPPSSHMPIAVAAAAPPPPPLPMHRPSSAASTPQYGRSQYPPDSASSGGHYYPQGSPLQLTESFVPSRTASQISIGGGPPTPKDQKSSSAIQAGAAAVSGASSSPSLRNLVH